MSSLSVTVRAATFGDGYALWLWANDPDTRAASFGRPPIAWPAHVAWLAARLADPACAVLIGEGAAGQPVGSIRFDSLDGRSTGRLSYVIAPESRGCGLSRPLVAAGTAWVRTAWPNVALWAEVLERNARSLAVFRALGWAEERSAPDVARFWLR